MSKLTIQPIRAAILNDLAEFVPERYCRGTDYGMDGWLVPEPYGIEQGSADIRLGRDLSLTNPAMTARQNAAATALYYLGWYVLEEAMDDDRQAAKAKQTHPTSEAKAAAEVRISSIFRKGRTHTEQLEICRRNMTEALKRYADFLPEREAAVLLKAAAAPAANGEAVPVTSPSSDDWKVQARAIADECFDHDTNATPSVRDSLATKNTRGQITGGYCFRVMVIMQERGIKGPRGIITSPETVMREALQGKKWWANKKK